MQTPRTSIRSENICHYRVNYECYESWTKGFVRGEARKYDENYYQRIRTIGEFKRSFTFRKRACFFLLFFRENNVAFRQMFDSRILCFCFSKRHRRRSSTHR